MWVPHPFDFAQGRLFPFFWERVGSTVHQPGDTRALSFRGVAHICLLLTIVGTGARGAKPGAPGSRRDFRRNLGSPLTINPRPIVTYKSR